MRIINFLLAFLLCAATAISLNGAERKTVELNTFGEENHIGGRMASNGYLLGKVLVIDCRDYSNPDVCDDVLKLEELWSAYKYKNFIVIGSHCGEGSAEKARENIEHWKLTYPVYERVYAPNPKAPEREPKRHLYVFDSTHQACLYAGNEYVKAMGISGKAISSSSAPTTLKQWKFIIDAERNVLPGSTFLRLKEFRLQFAEEAEMLYGDLWKEYKNDKEIVKLSKLVELSFNIKNCSPDDPKYKKLSQRTVQSAIKKYEDLKNSKNPNIVQEAKNAIADMMFVSAKLKKQ